MATLSQPFPTLEEILEISKNVDMPMMAESGEREAVTGDDRWVLINDLFYDIPATVLGRWFQANRSPQRTWAQHYARRLAILFTYQYMVLWEYDMMGVLERVPERYVRKLERLGPNIGDAGKEMLDRFYKAFGESGRASVHMATLLRSGGKVHDENLHNELVRAIMSLEMDPNQGAYQAPVHQRNVQLHIITHMCRDLPGFKRWVDAMAKTTGAQNGEAPGYLFQRYRAALGSLFHHWSNILSVYSSCGHLEKVPKWFLELNAHRIHPEDTSSQGQLAKYEQAFMRTGQVAIQAPGTALSLTVSKLIKQHESPGGKADVYNFHKEFHGELSRAVLGTTLPWPAIDEWLEMSDSLCYGRSPVPQISNDDYAAILNKALIGLTASTSITENGVRSVLASIGMDRHLGFSKVLCDSINVAAPRVEGGPRHTAVWDKTNRRRILLEMYVGVGCGDMAQRFCTSILERYKRLAGTPRPNDSLENPLLRHELSMCLDDLFSDWTQVLQLYKECGQPDKVPKWFVDEHRELFDRYTATMGVMQESGATPSMMDNYKRLSNVGKDALNRLAIYDDAVTSSNKRSTGLGEAAVKPQTEATSSSSSISVQEQDEAASTEAVAASEAELAEQEKEKETMETAWKEAIVVDDKEKTGGEEDESVVDEQIQDVLSIASAAATTSATAAQAVRRLDPIMRAMGFSVKSNTCGV
jgi:hypothetical protein